MVLYNLEQQILENRMLGDYRNMNIYLFVLEFVLSTLKD